MNWLAYATELARNQVAGGTPCSGEAKAPGSTQAMTPAPVPPVIVLADHRKKKRVAR